MLHSYLTEGHFVIMEKSNKVCLIFIPKHLGLTGKEEIEQITFYWPLLLLWSADNTKITVLNRASFQKY